jgi:hypothetical protein
MDEGKNKNLSTVKLEHLSKLHFKIYRNLFYKFAARPTLQRGRKGVGAFHPGG